MQQKLSLYLIIILISSINKINYSMTPEFMDYVDIFESEKKSSENSEGTQFNFDCIYTFQNINKKNNLGNTLLHYAAENNRIKILIYLLNKKNIRINVQNNKGQTALHLAVINNNILVVKELLKNSKINIFIDDYTSFPSNTPFSLACNLEDKSIKQLFLRHLINNPPNWSKPYKI